MGRFSDIERAEELRTAKIALEAWRALSKAAKQAAYATSKIGRRTNVPRRVAYIQPFGSGTNFWYETKVLTSPAPTDDIITANEETENALVTAVVTAVIGTTTGYAVTTAPIGANVVIKKARKIQFAKVKVIIPGTVAARVRISRFTGWSYLQSEVKGVSCSFGASTSIQDEGNVQRALTAALLVALPTAKISFTSQGFVG